MTEAGASGGRSEIERRLIQKSLKDESFRQQLLADPKAALEQELGTSLPEGLQVRAVEETADTIYLVLPPRAETEQSSGEISDEALQDVAGGLGGGTGAFDCFFSADCADERGITRPQLL